MNMHGMNQPGMGPVMPVVGVSPGMMQQSSPQQPPQMQNVMAPQQIQQQQQQPQPQPQQAEKMDNISKIKSFIGPLRESLSNTFKSAALVLQQNNLSDNLNKKDTSNSVARFDKHLEEFYSICDQIELHLKTSIQCVQQLSSSQHYLPGAVASVRMEPFMQSESQTSPMPYPQYLATVRAHIASAKDIHDTLISAAQNISQTD